jgi:hypothetical protein
MVKEAKETFSFQVAEGGGPTGAERLRAEQSKRGLQAISSLRLLLVGLRVE